MDDTEKLMYAATGCMIYISSMASAHHVPTEGLLQLVSELCTNELNRVNSLDPERNK